MVEVIDELGGSSRSRVQRIRFDGGTAIRKEWLDGPTEMWARESTALSVLPPGAPAPRLLDVSPGVVVMSDVGSGGNVADALLGADPVRATEAVVGWARALAELHRLTRGVGEAFGAALGRHGANHF